MNSPSFKGFHAQLDGKFTYGNTANTCIVYKVSCSETKQKKTRMMKNIAWHNC